MVRNPAEIIQESSPEALPQALEQREKLFHNKVVLITGGSRGIGRATALAFARDGALGVIITSRPQSEGQARLVTSELEQAGTQALWVPGDISDPRTPKGIIDQALSTFGKVDILVNNAGFTKDAPIQRMRDDDWEKVINTNLRGAAFLSRDALRAFPKNDGGVIINVVSVVGLYGNMWQSSYEASKGGLIALTKGLSVELADKGIRVNAVAPGFIDTEMTSLLSKELRELFIDATPMRRFGTPEDIAEVITFLASPRAQFMTGQVVEVDGGLGGSFRGAFQLNRRGYRKVGK